MFSLEKPRTMLVELSSVEVLSAVGTRELLSDASLPTALAPIVEVENEEAMCAAGFGGER
jgi:hypothetical protein